MQIPPEVLARIEAIETKLLELDPIMLKFCERRGFKFTRMVDENGTLWPRRGMWVREDIDRAMYLTMNLTVSEVMERGFYPDMPWSLSTTASLRPTKGQPTQLLQSEIFHALPYSQLTGVLEKSLEDGLTLLRRLTMDDAITKGEIVGPPLL
jgi:hypothetical protein